MLKKLMLIISLTLVSIVVNPLPVLAPPAPPLTYLMVRAAYSEKHPQGEVFSQNQWSSRLDHGGRWMEIVTFEIGYSGYRIAKMNGIPLTLIRTEPWHRPGDWDRIVDGWFRYWNANGHQQGTFTIEAWCATTPGRKMSDFIYIR